MEKKNHLFYCIRCVMYSIFVCKFESVQSVICKLFHAMLCQRSKNIPTEVIGSIYMTLC